MVNLLIVEDDAITREIFASVFSQSFTVAEAPDGETALKLIEEEKPPVILLDTNLPDMLGYDILDHIKNSPTLKHIKVAIVSANRSMDDIQKGCRKHQADRYFTKPACLPDIVRWVFAQLAEASIHALPGVRTR